MDEFDDFILEAAHEAEHNTCPTRLLITSAGIEVEVLYAHPGDPIVRWAALCSWTELDSMKTNHLLQIIREGTNALQASVLPEHPTRQ